MNLSQRCRSVDIIKYGNILLMKKLLREPIVFLLVLSLIVIVLNFHCGRSIIGIDNFSPYFSNATTFKRIFASGNFFYYGGLIFNWVSVFLVAIKVPFWVISNINLLLCLILGIVGIQLLIREVYGDRLKLENKTLKFNEYVTYYILPVLFFLCNLATIWIFNQPNLIFYAGFAGIPALLNFLLRVNERKSLLVWIYYIIGISYFFVTSLNLVAFGLFFMQVLVIGMIISRWFLNLDIKLFVKRILVVFGVWVVLIQMLILFSSNRSFIGIEIVGYFSEIQQNELSVDITRDLRASELQNNTLAGVSRFATGWMELSDNNGNLLFEFYELYKNNVLFILLGLTPVVIVFVALPVIKEQSRGYVCLALVLGMILVLMSKYVLLLIGGVPLVRDAFRWSSSKLWPSLLIIICLLFPVSVNSIISQYTEKTQKIILWILGLMFLVYGFPWFVGRAVSETVVVEIPAEYQELSRFSNEDKLLYLPGPQSAYFRQYAWGYFGSDFIGYISDADIVDNASLLSYDPDYACYETAFAKCDWDVLVENGFDYVVYDGSLIDEGDNISDCALGKVEFKGEYLWFVAVD